VAQVVLSRTRSDATRWRLIGAAEPRGPTTAGAAAGALRLPDTVHLQSVLTQSYVHMGLHMVAVGESRPATAANASRLAAAVGEAELRLQLSPTARVSDLLTVSLLPSSDELVLLYAQSCHLKVRCGCFRVQPGCRRIQSLARVYTRSSSQSPHLRPHARTQAPRTHTRRVRAGRLHALALPLPWRTHTSCARMRARVASTHAHHCACMYSTVACMRPLGTGALCTPDARTQQP
jgi:hypothetical protein